MTVLTPSTVPLTNFLEAYLAACQKGEVKFRTPEPKSKRKSKRRQAIQEQKHDVMMEEAAAYEEFRGKTKLTSLENSHFIQILETKDEVIQAKSETIGLLEDQNRALGSQVDKLKELLQALS